MRIGELSLQLSDPAGAIPWLQRSLRSRPDDVQALTLLADAQLRVGAISDARATVQRAIVLDPGNSRLLNVSARLRRLGA